MSEVGKLVLLASQKTTHEEIFRLNAVAAAAEIIAALAASGAPGINLASEFDSLSAYADKIQDALKVK